MTAITGFVRHLVEKKAIIMDIQLLRHQCKEIANPTNTTLSRTVVRNTILTPECLGEQSPATLSVFPRVQTPSALPWQSGSIGAVKEAFPPLAVMLHVVTW